MPDHQTSPVGEDAERAAFETWARDPVRSEKLPLDRWHTNGAYKDSRTYIAFYGFKAGMSAAPALDALGLPPPKYPNMRVLCHGNVSECCGYTAEQVRQAQRDAVAADRQARRETPLPDAEIADPEYMRGYVEGQNESFADAMATIADLRAQLASERQAKEYEQRHAVESEAALAQVQAELVAARQVGKHLFDTVADGAAPTQPKAQVGEGQ